MLTHRTRLGECFFDILYFVTTPQGGRQMNLNKVGFWAISITAFLVGLLMGIDSLAHQGIIPQSAKCTIVTWSIILTSIFITMKLLSIFERMNLEMRKVKDELEFAQMELSSTYLDQATYKAASNYYNRRASAGGNVIPFPIRMSD
jgi:hypothetical protein